ncbi:MAG: dipeptidase PepE [Nanoarchaeota archaeon]|nr:dipeptidase PepE [Nanoarchaeota archaeon]
MSDLLLISNTRVANGAPILAHARDEIREIYGDRKVITFVPYARPGGITHEAYRDVLAQAFAEMGYQLRLPSETSPFSSIASAEALFVGGGNTWHLLHMLQQHALLSLIYEQVQVGIPYVGSSAGSNVAGLTINNTNDMHAASVASTISLGCVPFNINPHYQETVTLTPEEREAVLAIAPQLRVVLDHQGETRDQRIKEYHALGNREPVVALREGAFVRVTDGNATLKGITGGRLFRPGKETIDLAPGTSLDTLLV